MEAKNSKPQITESVENSIIQLKNQILEAFNSGDAHGVALSYAKEAKFFPPNSKVVEGLNKIEAFWKIAMNKGIKKAKLETINIEASSTTVFEIGNYMLFLENGQIADFGEYVAIWRNMEDKWKLYLHQWNSGNPVNMIEDINMNINEAIINECEFSDIGCRYINFHSVKCNNCLC